MERRIGRNKIERGTSNGVKDLGKPRRDCQSWCNNEVLVADNLGYLSMWYCRGGTN